MTPPLFLVDAIPDGEVVLGGDEGRHAARVLRLQPGEDVLVADGDGTVAGCEVVAASGDTLTLRVIARRFEPEPNPRLVVAQALPKGDRAELAAELLTELGVDEIVPWAASRSIVRWDGARGERSLAKWRHTARAAAKQSRRARVPLVAEPLDAAGLAGRAAALLVLHEDATMPLVSAPLPTTGEVLLVVGPEGGIAPDELALFEQAGGTAVRLGEPVLRTSTAGGAALAVLSARLGRWGEPLA